MTTSEPGFRRDRRALLSALTSGVILGGCRTAARVPIRVPRPVQPESASVAPPPLVDEPREAPRLEFAAPDLSDERVLGYRAGLRPYRSRGPRVESEQQGEQVWIHNYGHGGAGWTLAFGCALDVQRLVEERVGGGVECIVVGGGIVGLSTAWVLARAGHGVRVLARDFPPHTTSNVAGGQFAPSLAGRMDSADRERWLRGSHGELTARLGAEWGVRRTDNYATRGSGQALLRIPRDLVHRCEELDKLPMGSRTRPGFVVGTLLIETPRFLERLLHDLDEAGVARERWEAQAREQIAELPAPVVVLCTGLGTREVLPNTGLRPLRGQLVHLEAQDLGYSLSTSGYLFARGDALVIGGTVERQFRSVEPDPETCRSLLARQRAFFASPG